MLVRGRKYQLTWKDQSGVLTKTTPKIRLFDWSQVPGDGDANSIYWAAFYSDCEHHIREVTIGHRLTLTYNLYTIRES